jgi:hypothetical protein
MTSPASGRLPQLLVLGAPKAGTTSLARWLDDHPDVAVTPKKELNFFSYDGVWTLGLDWYRAQFPGDASTVAVDASPSYLSAPEAPARIRQTIPDARLIAILRDPVDRTYAHYHWLLSWEAESRRFEEVIRTELDGEPTPMGCVDASRYAVHLERYAGHFPRTQLLVVDFQQLTERPVETFTDICEFAGLRRVVPESVGTAFNVGGHVRSWRLWRWLGNRQGGRSWREQPRGLDRMVFRSGGRPPMTSATRALLREYFAPYDDRLREFLGVEVLPWSSAAVGDHELPG